MDPQLLIFVFGMAFMMIVGYINDRRKKADDNGDLSTWTWVSATAALYLIVVGPMALGAA